MRVFSNANDIYLFLMIFPNLSLHCKLFPLQYRGTKMAYSAWSEYFFFFENLSTQGNGVAESAYHPYLLVIKHNYYSTSTHWIWNDKAHSAKLAIIISYSTSTGQILVLFKIPLKYKKLNFNLKRNKNNAKNYAHACHICRAWYNGSELLKWIIQWSRLWQIRLYQSTLILFLIKF